jgi:hypothetical protein
VQLAEVAEVAEVQKLQNHPTRQRFGQDLVKIWAIKLILAKAIGLSKCCRLRGTEELCSLRLRRLRRSDVTNSPSCRRVQQVVRCVFLSGITSALKLSKCFRLRDIEEVKFAEVSSQSAIE